MDSVVDGGLSGLPWTGRNGGSHTRALGRGSSTQLWRERERERTMGLCLVAAKGGGRDVIM
jgi:hypothetical protein